MSKSQLHDCKYSLKELKKGSLFYIVINDDSVIIIKKKKKLEVGETYVGVKLCFQGNVFQYESDISIGSKNLMNKLQSKYENCFLTSSWNEVISQIKS